MRCLVLVLALLSTGFAAPAEFLTRTWLVEDGLPNDSVNEVVFDRRGVMWLATGSGLSRFDGRQFREFPAPQLGDRDSRNLRALAVAGDALVMLPASGGVIQWRDGRLSVHPVTAALGSAALRDVFAESDGTVWVGTSTPSLVRWHEGHAQTFGAAEGITRRGDRFTVTPDHAGQTWVASFDYLARFKDGALAPVPGFSGTGLVICAAKTGGVWVASREALTRVTDRGAVPICTGDAWQDAAAGGIQVLREDRAGQLWIGTRRLGLFRLTDGAPVRVPLPHRIVNAITDDADGNLWVATGGGGLHRLRPKRVVMLDDAHGLDDDMSTGVCEDETGAVWCANRSGGVVRVAGGRVEQLAAPVDARAPYAVTVCPDGHGTIWVGASHGLFRAAVNGPRQLQTVVRATGSIHSLYCARDGTLWVGWGNGDLSILREGRLEPVAFAPGVPTGRAKSLTEDSRGRIWIGIDPGVIGVWENGSVRQAAVLPTGVISAITADADDRLWIASTRGLTLLADGRLRAFTTDDGLPESDIAQALDDGRGRLWCGSRRGIFWVEKADLLAVAAGTARTVGTGTVGADDGVHGASALTGGQPMVWRGRSGRLWFTTHNGIVGLDPNDFRDRRPVPLFVDDVIIDGQAVASPGDIRVPAGAYAVEATFLAPDYSTPEIVRLRHRLEGVDRDWVETPPDRGVSYAGLPPGQYRLHVAASRLGRRWPADAVNLALNVAPRWTQTWWFRSGLVLAFTAAVGWIARTWSHRRLRARLERLERDHALERERSRIARNLHDELGSSLTQVGLLADRITRHATDPALQPKLAQLANRTRRMTADLESIVWTVNPKNNTWDRLAAFAGRFAQEFCHEAALPCELTLGPNLPAAPIDPETQHHLIAVLKEALNNLVKHAHAQRVTIRIGADGPRFRLEITDDGRGFDPSAAAHARRNGLANLRARVAAIGGTLTLRSAPGEGTSIIVERAFAASPAFAARRAL